MSPVSNPSRTYLSRFALPPPAHARHRHCWKRAVHTSDGLVHPLPQQLDRLHTCTVDTLSWDQGPAQTNGDVSESPRRTRYGLRALFK